MAASLAIGDLIRGRVWTYAPSEIQAAVNTVYYVVAAVGSTPATDQDAADTLDAIVAPDYKALLSGLAEYRGVQMQLLKTAYPYHARLIAAETNVNAGTGTNASTYLPTQTSGLITYQSLNPGSKGRARTYVAFPSQDLDSGGGTPTGGYQTLLLALASDLGSGLALSTGGRTATLVRVVLHGPDKFTVVDPPSPIISWSVGARWATQRKRGNYGRPNRPPL